MEIFLRKKLLKHRNYLNSAILSIKALWSNTVKKCKDCLIEKPFEEFNKAGKYYQPYCKPCHCVRSKTWCEKNPEAKAENAKNWREKNPEYWKKWREENPESITEYNKNWNQKNPEYSKNYRKENKEALTEYKKNWVQENLDKHNANGAKRRSKKLQATPYWANQYLIQKFYTEAKCLEKIHHVKFHVDHVVPLVNIYVCGLNVPANLQIITQQDNNRKKNSFIPYVESEGNPNKQYKSYPIP